MSTPLSDASTETKLTESKTAVVDPPSIAPTPILTSKTQDIADTIPSTKTATAPIASGVADTVPISESTSVSKSSNSILPSIVSTKPASNTRSSGAQWNDLEDERKKNTSDVAADAGEDDDDMVVNSIGNVNQVNRTRDPNGYGLYELRTHQNVGAEVQDVQTQLETFTEQSDLDIISIRIIYSTPKDPQARRSKDKPRTGGFLAFLRNEFGQKLIEFKDADWQRDDSSRMYVFGCSEFDLMPAHYSHPKLNHTTGKHENSSPYVLMLSSFPTTRLPNDKIHSVLTGRLSRYLELFTCKYIENYDESDFKIRILHSNDTTTIFVDFNPYTLVDPVETVVKIRQLLFDSSWENDDDPSRCSRITCNFGRANDHHNIIFTPPPGVKEVSSAKDTPPSTSFRGRGRGRVSTTSSFRPRTFDSSRFHGVSNATNGSSSSRFDDKRMTSAKQSTSAVANSSVTRVAGGRVITRTATGVDSSSSIVDAKKEYSHQVPAVVASTAEGVHGQFTVSTSNPPVTHVSLGENKIVPPQASTVSVPAPVSSAPLSASSVSAPPPEDCHGVIMIRGVPYTITLRPMTPGQSHNALHVPQPQVPPPSSAVVGAPAMQYNAYPPIPNHSHSFTGPATNTGGNSTEGYTEYSPQGYWNNSYGLNPNGTQIHTHAGGQGHQTDSLQQTGYGSSYYHNPAAAPSYSQEFAHFTAPSPVPSDRDQGYGPRMNTVYRVTHPSASAQAPATPTTTTTTAPTLPPVLSARAPQFVSGTVPTLNSTNGSNANPTPAVKPSPIILPSTDVSQ